MKWEVQHVDKPAGLRRNYEYIFHNLIDEDDNLLGWVREDVINKVCTPATNAHSRVDYLWSNSKYNLEDAKAELIAFFVKERLDNA